MKFDHKTKIRCKFCGMKFEPKKLKYNLTTKMILETDLMLKHVGIDMKFIERPDLKHTDSSVIYLPFRVCEDCYLLFETMNEIKNSQIQIGNYFRIPVNDLNFGIEIHRKIDMESEERKKKNLEDLIKSFDGDFIKKAGSNLLNFGTLNKNGNPLGFNNLNLNGNNPNLNSNNFSTDENNNYNGGESSLASNKKNSPKKFGKNFLYRFMFVITDIILNEDMKLPDEKLYIIYYFFGKWYKIRLTDYYENLDYFNVNFSKIFYIICDENYGFIEYIDKNKSIDIKIGHFVEDPVKLKDQENAKLFKKEIIIEDLDTFTNIEDFVEYCGVQIECSAVRYADNNRNTMNGLLFKEDKPHYVGKLRCLMRVNKEKEIELENVKCTKHCNVRSFF